METLTNELFKGERIRSAIAYVSGDGHDWPLDYSHPDIMPLYELLRLHETMTGVDEFYALNRESDTAFDASVIQLLLPTQNQR